LRHDFEAQLSAQDSTVQESLQQTDSQKDKLKILAVRLKREKEELANNIAKLETENQELKRRLSKISDDLENLRTEKETDIRMMTMEHHKEFSTLKVCQMFIIV